MLSDDEASLHKLQEHFKIEHAQLLEYIQMAKLREETHLQRDIDLLKRRQENPNPSDDELSMGAFYESLEPQVRHAISVMRSKGYSTYESGFGGVGNIQKISFENPDLDILSFPDLLVEDLQSKGIKSSITPYSISLEFTKSITLLNLEKIWNMIASSLPDLNKDVSPSTLPQANDFRERYQN